MVCDKMEKWKSLDKIKYRTDKNVDEKYKPEELRSDEIIIKDDEYELKEFRLHRTDIPGLEPPKERLQAYKTKLGKIMKPVLEKHNRDEKAKAKRINNSIKFVTGDFDLFDGMHNSDIELDGNRSIDSKKSISEDDIDSSLLIASDNDDEEDEPI